jgi:hypothetical protein
MDENPLIMCIIFYLEIDTIDSLIRHVLTLLINQKMTWYWIKSNCCCLDFPQNEQKEGFSLTIYGRELVHPIMIKPFSYKMVDFLLLKTVLIVVLPSKLTKI